MNFKPSVKADFGGAVSGITGAKTGLLKNAEDTLSKTKGVGNGAVDQAKNNMSSAKSMAENGVKKISAEALAVVDSARKKIADTRAEIFKMKDQCLAAKEKFKNGISPAGGWKPTSADSSQLIIGKNFSQEASLTLNNGEYKLSDSLKVIFDINPNSIEKQDDRFILFSTDSAQSYYQEKTVNDDLQPADDKLSLLFEGLDNQLSYSLKIDQGDGSTPYHVFENRPFGDW